MTYNCECNKSAFVSPIWGIRGMPMPLKSLFCWKFRQTKCLAFSTDSPIPPLASHYQFISKNLYVNEHDACWCRYIYGYGYGYAYVSWIRYTWIIICIYIMNMIYGYKCTCLWGLCILMFISCQYAYRYELWSIVRISIWMCTCIYWCLYLANMHINSYYGVLMCIFIYICIHICIYSCTYTYTHAHTHVEADTHSKLNVTCYLHLRKFSNNFEKQ